MPTTTEETDMPYKFIVTVTETIERERTYTIKITKKEVVDFYEIPYEDQCDWEGFVERYIDDCLPDLQEAGRLVTDIVPGTSEEEITDTRVDNVEKED